MNYYQAPYKAALVRCCELGLLEESVDLDALLSLNAAGIRKYFDELWLDQSVLEATKKDDFANLETVVNRLGKEYIDTGYLSERTLSKARQNMRMLYYSTSIKGERFRFAGMPI